MNDFSSYTAKMVMSARETADNFIFDTISPFCQGITQTTISKQELIDALTQYRDLKEKYERLAAEVMKIRYKSDPHDPLGFTFQFSYDPFLSQVTTADVAETILRAFITADIQRRRNDPHGA